MEDKFQQIQTYLDRGQIPPVENWDPDFCGDSDMRILRSGQWLHQNTPIGRENLVKLFASVLKREGDDYFLVTPVEKLAISVDITPFVIVDMQVVQQHPQQIQLTTNLGEQFLLDNAHPLTIKQQNDEQLALVVVRRNLEAVINSSTFMQLCELAQQDETNPEHWYIESCNEKFALGLN